MQCIRCGAEMKIDQRCCLKCGALNPYNEDNQRYYDEDKLIEQERKLKMGKSSSKNKLWIFLFLVVLVIIIFIILSTFIK